MSCSVAGVALPPCAVGRAAVGVQSMKATPHPTRHALVLSAHQPSGRVPDHPPPGVLCQVGRPTHLGGEVLPADSVLRAVGVVLVPPVQVQLRGIVAGPEAPDLHVLGQSSEPWPAGCCLRAGWQQLLRAQTGAGGCSDGGTREVRLGNLGSFSENVPSSTKAIPVAAAPSWFPLENDGRN